jgi:hypothetical protein
VARVGGGNGKGISLTISSTFISQESLHWRDPKQLFASSCEKMEREHHNTSIDSFAG